MALIDGAQRSIHIETYVLEAYATGAILKGVIARAKDAVKVGLLIDGFGSFHMARRPLRRLRRAGARWPFFLPIWRLTLLNRSNLRDHRKIAHVRRRACLHVAGIGYCRSREYPA